MSFPRLQTEPLRRLRAVRSAKTIKIHEQVLVDIPGPYNTTTPTGVYAGKRWTREYGDDLWLCEWTATQKGCCVYGRKWR